MRGVELGAMPCDPQGAWIVWTADTGIIITGARLSATDELRCHECEAVLFVGEPFARQAAGARVAFECQACGARNAAM